MPHDRPLSAKLSSFSELSGPTGVSELASRTITSVTDAVSTPTPTAETLGVTFTGLLAIYWLLQIAQAFLWPLCAAFLGMLALAPGFTIGMLKLILPSYLLSLCRSFRSLPRCYTPTTSYVPVTDAQVFLPLPLSPTSSSLPTASSLHSTRPSSPTLPPTSPPTSPLPPISTSPSPPPKSSRPASSTLRTPEERMSQASLVMADSYLLLPHLISLHKPFTADPAQPGPSHAPPVQWVRSGPVQYTVIPKSTFHGPEATANFERPDQGSLPPRKDLEEIIEEEMSEDQPARVESDMSRCAAMFDSGEPSTSASKPVRAVVSDTSSAKSTIGELKCIDRQTKLRPKTSPVRSSGTSITLSNFCIPSTINSARLVMYASTAQLLSSPCIQSRHSCSKHTLSTIDCNSPIAGIFPPENPDSFLFTSAPSCSVESPSPGPSSDVRLATTGHPSMGFRLLPEDDDSFDSTIDMHAQSSAKNFPSNATTRRDSGSSEFLCDSSSSTGIPVPASVNTHEGGARENQTNARKKTKFL